MTSGPLLFRASTRTQLRTAIGRACKAAGVPALVATRPAPPADLAAAPPGRLLGRIAAFVGQRKLSLTADTYTHVLSDGRELDYAALIGGRA